MGWRRQPVFWRRHAAIRVLWRPVVTASCRHSLPWRPPLTASWNTLANLLARHAFSSRDLHIQLVTASRCNMWRRHHLVYFRVFWVFVVFRLFSLQKRPKLHLLRFSPPKYLKCEKKRLWVKSNHKMYELGLKRTLKNVTFFRLSNTLTLEICLSSSKWAFIPIEIQVRSHLMQI